MKSSLDRMEHGVLAFHALANLDQGDFTEGHELDRKWQVPKAMIGRRLAQAEAKRLLAKLE